MILHLFYSGIVSVIIQGTHCIMEYPLDVSREQTNIIQLG